MLPPRQFLRHVLWGTILEHLDHSNNMPCNFDLFRQLWYLSASFWIFQMKKYCLQAFNVDNLVHVIHEENMLMIIFVNSEWWWLMMLDSFWTSTGSIRQNMWAWKAILSSYGNLSIDNVSIFPKNSQNFWTTQDNWKIQNAPESA